MALNGMDREKNIKRVEGRLLILFSITVLMLTILLATVILRRSDEAIRDNTSELIAANSSQMQFNITSYLDKVESTVTLLFSDEAYYKYDATDSKLGEYDKIQCEKQIVNRIVDLGTIENFADFGVIYSNNYSVGWMSKTTQSIFDQEKIYELVSSNITNDKTHDGWFFGINDNYDRLYYVKRLNPNAVVLASFYTRELSNVFELPKELKGMILRLTDGDNRILYSSKKGEIGKVNDIVDSKKGYIVNIRSCGKDWHIVCAVPEEIILKDTIALRRFTMSISIVVAIIFIVGGLVVFKRFTKPMDSIVSDLEQQASIDRLAGVYNKISYEENAQRVLDSLSGGGRVTLIMMDMDHFKTINDTMGHAYGDEVITRTGELLRREFSSNVMIGRIGGDEFSLLSVNRIIGLKEATEHAKKRMEHLRNEFLIDFEKEHEACGASLSIGVYVCDYNGESFEEMYKKADRALYISKESGRNRCTFYDDSMKIEEDAKDE